jgi:hypothetical protein
MTTTLNDGVIAIEMDGDMRVRLQDWTPAWAYDVLYERLLDSRSIDLSTVSDGEYLGEAQLNTDQERLDWFHPR